MALTKKQIQLLNTIKSGDDVDDPLDLDDILDALPYQTTKQSLQFSIRALINKGMIERSELRKRGGIGQARRTIRLTDFGRAVLTL